MPLALNFKIEERGGMTVIVIPSKEGETETVRAALPTEIELWNALARRVAAPTRESYIRVNEQDLVAALMERDQLRKQVNELQKKNKELEEENNRLRGVLLP